MNSATRELTEVLILLAENQNLRVCVQSSDYTSPITGGRTLLGGLLLGRMEILAGGKSLFKNIHVINCVTLP